MKKVAFIGLGVMGYPMAGHLQKSEGIEVTVFNRTTSKAENWVKEFGGKMARNPALAAEDAELVFCCVGNDSDLYQVTASESGALWSIKEGAIFVDHTTASATMAKKLNQEFLRKGAGFMDAPISGGAEGAKKGSLTIMCGSKQQTFEAVEPIFKCYAKSAVLLGPAGSGQLCKMVNQISIAGLLQGLSEGLFFAENCGLDPHKVVEVISQGAAGSWQMENRHKTMIEGNFDHGFAVEWMRKDLDICFKEAESLKLRLPITKLVDSFYRKVEEMDGRRWDTSSLIEVLRQNKKKQI